MKPARRPPQGKSRKGGPARSPASPPRAPLDVRLGTFFLWLLVLMPPFVLARLAKESFRQPKLMVSEWLALASLVCLAWGLRRVDKVRLADLWKLPAVRMTVPCLAVATAGLAATQHPAHVREALTDLWIGAAALVGWSALDAARLERLLRLLLWPATFLALIGIAQFYGEQPLPLFGLEPGSRLTITSLAGNPGDLGAYLVLPCLVAQDVLRRRLREDLGWRQPGFWGTLFALAVSLYALLLTQTLSAVAAILAGSLLFWVVALPRRRAVAFLAGGAVATILLVAAVAPLRQRVVEKARQVATGDLNSVLTGRLDGWRAALWMLREHPWTGVGHGAYRPEFVPAKLALLDRGVPFFSEQTQVVFGNAHNEFLDAAAEWGIPGIVALGWSLWVLLGALRTLRGNNAGPLAWAGTASLAVLCLMHFPFHVALVAFPALLFLSWVLRSAEEAA